MLEKRDSYELIKKCLLICCLLFTLVSIITKTVIGLEIDETYLVGMGVRFLHGEHLFREIWDLHQTCAVPVAILIALYNAVTGGLAGVIVFLRVITALLSLIQGYVVYKILGRYYSNAEWAGIFVANYQARVMQNLDYGLLSHMLMIYSSLIILCVCKEYKNYTKTRKIVYIVLAGILFSFSIFNYPTMMICAIIPIAFLIIRIYKKDISFLELTKWGTLFYGTCIVCAITVVSYMLSYMSPKEMIENIQFTVFGDEFHQTSNKLISMFSTLITDRSKTIQVILIPAFIIVLFCIFRFVLKKDVPIVYHALSGPSIALILLNITGIRLSGPFGLQIRFVFIVLLGTTLVLKRNDKALFWLFFMMGNMFFIGSLLGSALSITENSLFLGLSVIAVIVSLDWDIGNDSVCRRYALISAFVFVFSVIFTRGYLVRISGTGPANIFERRELLDYGPAAGIYVELDTAKQYKEGMQDIDNLSTGDDVIQVIGMDAYYNYILDRNFSAPTIISEKVSGKQWVDYYTKRDYADPTVIFVDRTIYPDLNSFCSDNLYGAYIAKEYDIDSFYETDLFYVIRK